MRLISALWAWSLSTGAPRAENLILSWYASVCAVALLLFILDGDGKSAAVSLTMATAIAVVLFLYIICRRMRR